MNINTKIQEKGALESDEELEVVKHGDAVNVLQSTGLFVLWGEKKEPPPPPWQVTSNH